MYLVLCFDCWRSVFHPQIGASGLPALRFTGEQAGVYIRLEKGGERAEKLFSPALELSEKV